MSHDLTVVMYHYVRERSRSRYPALNALDLGRFRDQIRWAMAHHTVVRMEQVLAALAGDEPLPPKALLLTFDDGYADHYRYVFPILDDLRLQGSFYPAARSTLHGGVLTPNKLHLVLASVADPATVAHGVLEWLGRHGSAHGLADGDHYRATYAKPTRFDSAEVGFVKRMVQHALPEAPRAALLDALFVRYVGESEATIAEELYASAEQLRTMRRHGMHLGGHGVDHAWLTTLPHAAQCAELDGSVELLAQLGADLDAWTFAYPYGDHDDGVVELLAARGCRAAFTIVPELARVDPAQRLRLPRFDTNDLPPAR